MSVENEILLTAKTVKVKKVKTQDEINAMMGKVIEKVPVLKIKSVHAVTIPVVLEMIPAKKKAVKPYVHLKPKEVKATGEFKRKEVLLTNIVIAKLERKAKSEGIDLKKFMEKCLIKISSMPTFDISI